MKKVLVFGTFDGLHEGHLNFFKQASEYGDYLVLVVARDSTVKKNKGKSPKFNEQERLKKVQNCKLVYEALLGSEGHNPQDDPYTMIGEIKPDIICLGYDQANFAGKLDDELERMNLDVKVKILKPHKPQTYKSSLLNA